MNPPSREYLDMAHVKDGTGLVTSAGGAHNHPMRSGVSFTVSVLSCSDSSTPTQEKKETPFTLHMHVPRNLTNISFEMDSTPYAPRPTQSQNVSEMEQVMGPAYPQNLMFSPPWAWSMSFTDGVTAALRPPNPMQYM
ncbi:hypothetical protein M758_UG291700 [Ceratodon purpureus]|nr:hypothetical protein M758_UG291700 [Ceratodon purpureus]